jgi:hypothetical protein
MTKTDIEAIAEAFGINVDIQEVEAMEIIEE